MDEIPSVPATPPSPAPTDPHLHPAGVRRMKRRLMMAVIGLYGLSIVAAGVLLMRPQAAKGGKDGADKGIFAQTETVGWVPVHGVISSSEGGRLWEKGVEQWVRKLNAMADTQGVKAIILDINSPGGSVGAVQELHSQILRVRKEKNIPIVALIGDVAASGGYYIAAACDRIVVHPGSITGSIGVIFSVQNMEGLFGKIGYKMDPIKSGRHKDIGSPARPMTAEERSMLQDLINEAYGQFLSAVAVGRHLSEEEVRPWADGRIYSGSQALKYKLVDKVGDSTDAVELAGELGGISGTPKVRRDVDSTRWLMDMIESRWSGRLEGFLSDRLPRAGLEYRWSGW